MHMHLLWAVFVQFILVRRPHCASRLQHWPSCLNRPILAGESVDQWSHVPTGTVVEQIAFIAAVINATSVHSLQQRTTPIPLTSPGLTACVRSQSPRQVTCANHTYSGGQNYCITWAKYSNSLTFYCLWTKLNPISFFLTFICPIYLFSMKIYVPILCNCLILANVAIIIH